MHLYLQYISIWTKTINHKNHNLSTGSSYSINNVVKITQLVVSQRKEEKMEIITSYPYKKRLDLNIKPFKKLQRFNSGKIITIRYKCYFKFSLKR